MGNFSRRLCGVGLVMWLLASISVAQEVSILHKGLRLNADLHTLRDGTQNDSIILITHGALAHRDMETIAYLRKLLNERGHNTLAINLSLGIDDRHGMYDCKQTHRHQDSDAISEIGQWVDWLKQRGHRRVIVMGHSRGGAQIARYAAQHSDPSIEAVILLAPATASTTSSAQYHKRFNQALAPILAQARQLADADNGTETIEHVGILSCQDSTVTASSFISYYGEQSSQDLQSLLSIINQRTLVIAASEDEIVTDLQEKITPLVDNKRVFLQVIPGSDHFFRDLNADDAVDLIDKFIKPPVN